MELEPSQGIAITSPGDTRPRLEEPPPVKLVTVEDARIPAAAGLERQLDEFYIGLLKFVREDDVAMVYRAENFRLRIEVVEPPVERGGLYPLRIEVPLLRDLVGSLIEREIPYERLKGLLPAQEVIALLDPAGNYLEVMESRPV